MVPPACSSVANQRKSLDLQEIANARGWSAEGLGWNAIQGCKCGARATFCVCEGMDCQRFSNWKREADNLNPGETKEGGTGSTLRESTE
eukprot:4792817-Pyramimonas_sp.AAC.1